MSEAFLAAVNRWLGLALAVVVGFMMAITFVDVVGRQVFNVPLPASFEMTRIALGLMVFIGLPVVTGHNEHITIGLLNGVFSKRALRVKRCILSILCAALTGFLAWRIWVQAGKLDAQNEKFMFLQIKLAPFVYSMALLSVAAAILFLVRARIALIPRDDKDELIGV